MSMETDRIESDLNDSRTRLNDTLKAMGNKLSPGQMLDEVMGLAQGQAGQFAGNLGRQVRDNPLPALLIGAGVALYALNARHGHAHDDGDWHAERRYRSLEEARWANPRQDGESDDDYGARMHDHYSRALDMKQRAGEAAHEFKARVSQTVDGIRDAAHSARERLGQGAAQASHYVADKARNLGDRASHLAGDAQNMYQNTPLAAGALALAIGALIGASTPLTDMERERLEDVADAATRAGANLAERGAKLVDEKVSAVH